MPTFIEIPEPETQDALQAAETRRRERQRRCDRVEGPELPAHSLFSDSLLSSSSSERRRRSLATAMSIVVQCIGISALLIVPLMFTEALPTQQLITFLLAPPPPPPPPPPSAPAIRVVQTDMLNSGQLRTPTRIPRKVEMIREDEAPPPANAGGVLGGIPGGVPGGQLGGVIGGIISSGATSTAMVPRPEPVKRVRVSQGVTLGMLISKIEPKYPKIALAAHITGVVFLKAIISKEGKIQELQTIEGHPVLIPAAIEAVKQWRYRPFLLNGEPVGVETTIIVTFQISN